MINLARYIRRQAALASPFLALFVIALVYPLPSQALTFTNDFNRSDWTAAGNRGSDTAGNHNGNLTTASAAVSTSSPLSLGNENLSKAQSALANKETVFIGAVEVTGVVGIADKWKVTLKDCTTGETRTLREGDAAFGYQIKSIIPQGAILKSADKEYKLNIGEFASAISLPSPCQRTSVKSDILSSPIPDLALMGNTEREQWVAHWRRILSTLTLQDQEDARQRMRDYWRQQWEEQWEEVIFKMTSEEQEDLRREMSSYWKW